MAAMTDQPVAGLVMAAYNAGPFLARAIQGVAEQSMSDFVCCIVDDGSTDGTGDLARKLTADDPRFMVIEQENEGQASARNHGVKLLPPTTYVNFPDADDVWHPDALRTLVEAAEEHGGVGSHALADQVDVDDAPFQPGAFIALGRDRYITRRLKKLPLSSDAPSNFESLANSCTAYPPGLWLIRRDIFEEIGGFDTWFQNFEDWDLMIRASRHGDFAFVDDVILDYRAHPEQISMRPHNDLAYLAVKAKTYKSPVNTRRQRKAAHVAWRKDEAKFTGEFLRLIVKNPKNASHSVRQVGIHGLRFLAGPVKIRIPEFPQEGASHSLAA
jgi:glycosyltransferase involved in cell wall biosynthesis